MEQRKSNDRLLKAYQWVCLFYVLTAILAFLNVFIGALYGENGYFPMGFGASSLVLYLCRGMENSSLRVALSALAGLLAGIALLLLAGKAAKGRFVALLGANLLYLVDFSISLTLFCLSLGVGVAETIIHSAFLVMGLGSIVLYFVLDQRLKNEQR